MAGFFATDYFTRQAEMMQSALSDEDIAHQLNMLYLPPDTVHGLAVPNAYQAPVSSNRPGASSSTRRSEARNAGSSGLGVSKAEEDYLFVLGIYLKPIAPEKECGLCKTTKPLTVFISTKDCDHEYCTDCCKTYAELIISLTLKTSQIKCPHPSCRHNFHIDQCSTLLCEASLDILNLGLREVATPSSHRVCCVRKPETSNSASATFIDCFCHHGFCLACNTAWERECSMCANAVLHTEFIGTKDCAHSYCNDCCKQHAEMKIRLTKTSQIECPHPSCQHNFDIEQCKTLLSKKSFEILNIRQVEAAIPISQRVYCPFEDCSSFIPILKPELSSSARDTFVECYSCHRGICVDCNVPWEKECEICADSVQHNEFISTIDCAHGYCIGCCKQHAEVKILSGSSEIKCPHPDCTHNFDIEQCITLLSPANFDILNTRLTEAAIPAGQKVFCPFQDCSIMMEKAESSSSARNTFAACYSCYRGFCLECKVPWHSNMSCGEYRAHIENTKQGGDQKLKALATEKGWKRCPIPNCGVMVEKKSGCNHMTCWYKHEFCYKCGLPYENKKATCVCPL
ncbi:hypothetical protein M758_5G065800 [Ceratodon purpureus]|nr:hypothetical protein M758_5G065800 [Ceratodon purpureus]